MGFRLSAIIKNRRAVALATVVLLLIVSFPIALAQLSQSGDPTSGSQTYFLDSTTNVPPCGAYPLDYQTQPGASSNAPIFGDSLFCSPSSGPGITTEDVSLVMWVIASTPRTVVENQIAAIDLTSGCPPACAEPTFDGTISVTSTSCSSPTLVTIELTTSVPYTFNPGDGVGLSMFSLNNPGFSICTGGHYASYITIDPLEQTTATVTDTMTSVSTTTQTVTSTTTSDSTSVSTTTATTTLVLSPTQTNVSCSPTDFKPGEQTTCTATVSNLPSNSTSGGVPTGTVSFASSDDAGTFSTPSCSTSGSTLRCTASYSSTAERDQTITASYSGDGTHTTSQGSTIVHVHK